MSTTAGLRLGWLRLAVLLAIAVTGLLAIGLRGESTAGQTAQASATKRVDIDNFAFDPPTLSVAKGSRVVFANSSAVAHTATRDGSFTTGRIKPGKSASVSFGQRGSFAYHCEIHPLMHGKIVVK